MQTTKATALGIAVLLVLASMSAPVAANPIGDIFGEDSEEEDSLLPDVDTILGAVEGLQARATSWIDRTRGASPTSTEVAVDVTDRFNSNSDAILGYVNERSEADSDSRITKLTFVLDGEETDRYLVTEINSTEGNYTDLVMLSSGEYSDRGLDESDVDEEVRLEDGAAQNADEELETFLDEYVETDTDPDKGYLSRLGAQYAGSVDATFEW